MNYNKHYIGRSYTSSFFICFLIFKNFIRSDINMKQLSQVEILSLTAILKAESDGLKMQRALNTVITDEDLNGFSEELRDDINTVIKRFG